LPGNGAASDVIMTSDRRRGLEEVTVAARTLRSGTKFILAVERLIVGAGPEPTMTTLIDDRVSGAAGRHDA
jgi:hypothetical protein